MKKVSVLSIFFILFFLFATTGLIGCSDKSAVSESTPEGTPSSSTESFIAVSPNTDDIAQQRIASVMKASDVNINSIHGTTYYVSPDGEDSNSGTEPENPIKTLSHIEKLSLMPGDAVLFQRNGVWRGSLHAKEGVTYGAYGNGDKPRIYGSKQNYAAPSLWMQTDAANVWSCKEELKNVGIVVFNPSYEIGEKADTVGQMRIPGYGEFQDYHQLDSDLQYCTDKQSKTLYVYSEKGNPGERFDAIEIGDYGNIIKNTSRTTIDNICFMFGGSHGIGSKTAHDVTVRNCVFAWIGASILSGTTRYGNAIEIFGGCDGFYVYNNYIYQIYDTGITFQSNTDIDSPQSNVDIYDNLIEHCHWSIEFYNYPKTFGFDKKVTDIDIHHNLIRYNGYGWGSVTRQSTSEAIKSCGMSDTVSNFVIRENISDLSLGYHVSMQDLSGDRQVEFQNNTYYQAVGYPWMIIDGQRYSFDSVDDAKRISTTLLEELNPTIYERHLENSGKMTGNS